MSWSQICRVTSRRDALRERAKYAPFGALPFARGVWACWGQPFHWTSMRAAAAQEPRWPVHCSMTKPQSKYLSSERISEVLQPFPPENSPSKHRRDCSNAIFKTEGRSFITSFDFLSPIHLSGIIGISGEFCPVWK